MGNTPRISSILGLILLLVAAMPAFGQDTFDAPVCIYAISKDLCKAELARGIWSQPVCPDPGAPNAQCTTLAGNNAHLSGTLTNGTGTCGTFAETLCDEAPELQGSFVVTGLDYRAQRANSCTARGHWRGTWSLISPFTGQTIATGGLQATTGVGTHRKSCEDNACTTPVCEGCWDARLLPSPVDPPVFRWEIGNEGLITGRVLTGRYAGCTLHASFHGDFRALGDSRGPLAPNPNWDFCGNLDGVLECPCPNAAFFDD